MKIPSNRITKLFIKEESLPVDLEFGRVVQNLHRFLDRNWSREKYTRKKFCRIGPKHAEWIFLCLMILFSSSLYSIRMDDFFVRFSINDQIQEGLMAQKIIFEGDVVLVEPWPTPNHGEFFAYILTVFYTLFGMGISTSRLCMLFLNILFITFAYLCSRRLFNRTAAAVTMFLFVFSPFFVFQAYAIDNWAALQIFELLSLYIFVVSYKMQNKRALITGALLVGIMLDIHSLAFYWLFALVITGFLFRFRPSKADCLVVSIAILLPIAPMVVSQLLFQSSTPFTTITQNMFETGYGHNNLDIFGNMAANIGMHSRMVLGGQIDLVGGSFIFDSLVGLGFIGAILFALFSKSPKKFFLLSLVGIMVFGTQFTVTKVREHHSLIILPLVFLLAGEFYSRLASLNLAVTFIVVLLILFYSGEFLTMIYPYLDAFLLDLDGLSHLERVASYQEILFSTCHIHNLYIFIDRIDDNMYENEFLDVPEDTRVNGSISETYNYYISAGKSYFVFEDNPEGGNMDLVDDFLEFVDEENLDCGVVANSSAHEVSYLVYHVR